MRRGRQRDFHGAEVRELAKQRVIDGAHVLFLAFPAGRGCEGVEDVSVESSQLGRACKLNIGDPRVIRPSHEGIVSFERTAGTNLDGRVLQLSRATECYALVMSGEFMKCDRPDTSGTIWYLSE